MFVILNFARARMNKIGVIFQVRLCYSLKNIIFQFLLTFLWGQWKYAWPNCNLHCSVAFTICPGSFLWKTLGISVKLCGLSSRHSEPDPLSGNTTPRALFSEQNLTFSPILLQEGKGCRKTPHEFSEPRFSSTDFLFCHGFVTILYLNCNYNYYIC